MIYYFLILPNIKTQDLYHVIVSYANSRIFSTNFMYKVKLTVLALPKIFN